MFQISSPTLLLDKDKLRANVHRMVDKAAANNLTFKPHFKTHQSAQIGSIIQEQGVGEITVSSVAMAEYFAGHGWSDITIAFPCNILLADRIDALAAHITLSVLVSETVTADRLQKQLNHPVQVYIEIDTGSQRTGIPSRNTGEIELLMEQIANSELLKLKGFYSHPGHSYSARSADEVRAVHRDVTKQMQQLKSHFKSRYPHIVNCVGDTPCCSTGTGWEGIDEISPGNFVFYDLMQTHIGSCETGDIAVALACPVVAKYPERQEIVVHAGAVHLSKDSITGDSITHFGRPVRLQNNFKWAEPEKECFVKSISQEHGIVKCSESFFEKTAIGDVIGILPVHSCLTADCMKGYTAIADWEHLEHLQGTDH